MWETTALHVPFSKIRKKVKVRGLPHLAKNERDMGHPTLCGRDKERKGLPGREALLVIGFWKGYWLMVLTAGALVAESVVSFSAK
jgi:hypothetical protein